MKGHQKARLKANHLVRLLAQTFPRPRSILLEKQLSGRESADWLGQGWADLWGQKSAEQWGQELVG